MDSLYRRFEGMAAEMCSEYMEKIGCETPALERPDPSMGDVAVPCFSLARVLKKNPSIIAEEMAAFLSKNDRREVKSILAKGGYVNFTMDPVWVAETVVPEILEKKNYGMLAQRGEKIVLEHTSANPTDKLHVGRARNPIIGDTLARICRYAGYEVETQYYVDDMGRQAVTLAYGNHLWEKLGDEEKASFLGPYQYASDLFAGDSEREEDFRTWLHALETQSDLQVGDVPLQEFVDKACRRIMEEKINPALHRMGVSIDRYVYESDFMKNGTVAEVLKRLMKTPDALQDDNGAWYIDMEPHGITGRNTRFFFTRGDGTSLYATRDIAYHLWKLRNYDRVVDILGEDHRLEAKQVAVALSLLGEEQMPDVVFYAFVGLPEGKMSTRKGKVVYVDDLLDEGVERAEQEVATRRPDLDDEDKKHIALSVGISAVRYNVARIQPEKKMVFKWDEALNFEGDSAPFIQYSYARATSIMNKSISVEPGRASNLVHPAETALIKHLSRFPDVVEDCALSMRPHLMASYSHSTAVLFNQFYRDCPVLSEEADVRNSRLTLVSAARRVLHGSMDLIGITALEEM